MNARLLMAALSLVVFSCGSSMSSDAGIDSGTATGGGTAATGGGTAATGGGTAATGGGTATGGGSAATGGGSAATGGGTAAAATCAHYCTTIGTNCTATNAEYGSEAACLGSCSALAQGDAGVTSGNSLECRNYHATAAAGGAALHCPHAGPAGDGVCGSNCESFCTLAMAKCSAVFGTMQACTTACAAFPQNTAHYTSSALLGDTFSCRMYHLSVAATDSTFAATHCPHIAAVSAVCK